MLPSILAAYLPMDRRQALASGTALPEHSQGAVLFADLADFTTLSESFTRALGPHRGAEEIARQLEHVYDALLPLVHQYGGSVLGFAGDALTAYFDQDEGLRATACALAMQAAIEALGSALLPTGEAISLGLKVGLAAGPVRRLLVGDPQQRVLEVLAGRVLTRATEAEQQARRGEVLLDGACARRLEEALDLARWHSTPSHPPGYGVVQALRREVPPCPWPALDPALLPDEQLRPWLLPTVYQRLQAGQGEFLTEVRPVVTLFLRFEGIDDERDPGAGAKLDALVRWVQMEAAAHDGTLADLVLGDKGGYLYLSFGAPIAHEDDAWRALRVAQVLRQPPATLAAQRVQIGVSQGTACVGAYGGTLRRTYGVLGDEVNLAARLMEHAAPGEVLASGRVRTLVGPRARWQARGALTLKGKQEALPVYRLLDVHAHPALSLPDATVPLVGRDAEQAVLRDALARTLAGAGQVVTLVGEAGIGKSRLVADLLAQAEAQPMVRYGASAPPSGTGSSSLAWQPIWRAFFRSPPSARRPRCTRLSQSLIRRLCPGCPSSGRFWA